LIVQISEIFGRSEVLTVVGCVVPDDLKGCSAFIFKGQKLRECEILVSFKSSRTNDTIIAGSYPSRS
jgi:hypothetical protein